MGTEPATPADQGTNFVSDANHVLQNPVNDAVGWSNSDTARAAVLDNHVGNVELGRTRANITNACLPLAIDDHIFDMDSVGRKNSDAVFTSATSFDGKIA